MGWTSLRLADTFTMTQAFRSGDVLQRLYMAACMEAGCCVAFPAACDDLLTRQMHEKGIQQALHDAVACAITPYAQQS